MLNANEGVLTANETKGSTLTREGGIQSQGGLYSMPTRGGAQYQRGAALDADEGEGCKMPMREGSQWPTRGRGDAICKQGGAFNPNEGEGRSIPTSGE